MNTKTLLAEEPALQHILREAKARKRGGYRRRWNAYEILKDKARPFVGYHAKNEALRSSEAWECFTREVMEALGL